VAYHAIAPAKDTPQPAPDTKEARVTPGEDDMKDRLRTGIIHNERRGDDVPIQTQAMPATIKGRAVSLMAQPSNNYMHGPIS
jgi:hypothetical protein